MIGCFVRYTAFPEESNVNFVGCFLLRFDLPSTTFQLFWLLFGEEVGTIAGVLAIGVIIVGVGVEVDREGIMTSTF